MVQETGTSNASSLLGLKSTLVLAQLNPEADALWMVGAHNDSDDFRDFARWALKRKRSDDRDRVIRFETNSVSSDIDVCIYDAKTWALMRTMTPHGVMEDLMRLETGEEIDAPLTSFYIDIHV